MRNRQNHPRSVKVGGHTYHVEFVGAGDARLQDERRNYYVDHERYRLFVRSGLSEDGRRREVWQAVGQCRRDWAEATMQASEDERDLRRQRRTRSAANSFAGGMQVGRDVYTVQAVPGDAPVLTDAAGVRHRASIDHDDRVIFINGDLPPAAQKLVRERAVSQARQEMCMALYEQDQGDGWLPPVGEDEPDHRSPSAPARSPANHEVLPAGDDGAWLEDWLAAVERIAGDDDGVT